MIRIKNFRLTSNEIKVVLLATLSFHFIACKKDSVALPEQEPIGPFILYMSPNGSDENTGLTQQDALLTLNGVHEKLKQVKPVIDQDIEVRIRFISHKPYMGQTVDWTHTSPEHTISFMPSDYYYGAGIDDIAGRPVFDGQGKEDWFFDLRSGKGEKTNLRFYYLKIQGYIPGGIRFYGNKHLFEEKWNGYNTVLGCYFFEIGNKKYPNSDFGFGALDLVNSDHNTIQLNHFVHAENRSGHESHMHGVYLAHSSDYNLIKSIAKAEWF